MGASVCQIFPQFLTFYTSVLLHAANDGKTHSAPLVFEEGATAIEPYKAAKHPNTMSEKKETIACEECDKKTQKDLPSSEQKMPCQEAYAAVTKCMKKNNGQISPCVKEWDEFKACHEKRNASK